MQYRGLTLDEFQERSIVALEEGRSVLVSAPTGTGKTVIADWIIEASLAAGQRVIYTAPVKALSNQKFRDYCRMHGEENVGLVTGDLVVRRDAPCLVMTTEILRNMLLSEDDLDDLGAVVLDEVHFLDDRERGTVWEEVLIYLPRSVQVVGLSATLPNLDELAAWMRKVRDRDVDVITENERAVPLRFHLASARTGLVPAERVTAGTARKRPKRASARGGRDRRERGTTHLDIFRIMKEEELLPYLYFTFSRKNTEGFARRLARRLGPGALLTADELDELNARLDAAAPGLGNAMDEELRDVYRSGVAYHHAGLHVQIKVLVEELYEARLIKVLYCTSTFALGVNMPARSAVFDDLQKFDGQEVRPLTVRQFMQKAGRAGRRGMDTVGHVVMRLDPDDYDRHRASIRRYLRGAYEPVRSSFNLSFNSVTNLIGRHDSEACRDLVYRSFLAWHLDHEAERATAEAARLEAAGASGKELRKLRRHAARSSDRCWHEFELKVGLLRDVGYIDAEGTFAAGARVLRHVQISEVFVTELVLNGVLEDLDDGTLFGLMCAIVSELPRGVTRHYHLPRSDIALVRTAERVLRAGVVTAADELAGTQTSFGPDLIPLGRAWHDGNSLDELMAKLSSRTDVSGSVISAFRRAKDLAGQLRQAYLDSGLDDHVDQLRRVLRAVSRDEVEVVA